MVEHRKGFTEGDNMKVYKIKGTTDDVTTCELCGRPELKGTVMLVSLDADGNEDGDVSYFGTSCAAKATGWTIREVKAGVKAAKDEARDRLRAERDAMWAAEREFLAGWYLTHYGTTDLHIAADRAGVSAVKLSGEAIHAYREVQRTAEPAPAEKLAEELEVAEELTVGYRETLVRVADAECVIRTEVGGKIRTSKQLETAHTNAVKAALIEMRRANLTAFKAAAEAAEEKSERVGRRWLEEKDAKRARAIVRRAERGTFHSHISPWATDLKPFPKVRFTDKVPVYLVEVAPGHYATAEAAEQLTLC
ncbi:hypothetical protein GCM10010327_19750 [Streptomyces nitrosporeus]|nr:hypothetical protein GCM10010327_19750 [Streptomyces nitrosporeus]